MCDVIVQSSCILAPKIVSVKLKSNETINMKSTRIEEKVKEKGKLNKTSKGKQKPDEKVKKLREVIKRRTLTFKTVNKTEETDTDLHFPPFYAQAMQNKCQKMLKEEKKYTHG